MTPDLIKASDATNDRIKAVLAAAGPLQECSCGSAGGQSFCTADHRYSVCERTLLRLASARIVHMEGQSPSRIARLTS